MATKVIDLAKLKTDLEQAKINYANLQRDVSAALQRMNDLTAYIDLTERLYPELVQPPTGDEVPAEVPPEPAEPFGEMGTKQAAIAVLQSTAPRAWKVEELTAEMQRRGWNPDAKQRPVLLVASAMSRLFLGGEAPITKPKYGYYAWRLPDGLSASGMAVASGSASLGPPLTLSATGAAKSSGTASFGPGGGDRP